jgi:hypothetical protein
MGKIGTRNNKTVVGITAITFLWKNGTQFDQCRPATPFKISWHSYMWFFSHFDLIPHKWQMTADG